MIDPGTTGFRVSGLRVQHQSDHKKERGSLRAGPCEGTWRTSENPEPLNLLIEINMLRLLNPNPKLQILNPKPYILNLNPIS